LGLPPAGPRGRRGGALRRVADAPSTVLIGALLLAALALRLIIAYGLFPAAGFEPDISSFSHWALTMAWAGPGPFYSVVGFADYPPAYFYLLWPVGIAANVVAALGGTDPASAAVLLIKVPPILADLVVGYLIYRLAARWGGFTSRSVWPAVCAGLYLFNPVTWYDSALWGQVDAVGALVVLVTLALLIEGDIELAAGSAVLAGLLKPQFGILLAPIVLVVALRRYVLAPGSGPAGGLFPFPGFVSHRGPIRLVSSAAVGLAVLIVVVAPFRLGVVQLASVLGLAASEYPWLTVNAYNPWALLGTEGVPPLAEVFPLWSSDTAALVGPLPGVALGTALLVAGFGAGLLALSRRDDARSILVATLFLALCFFVLPTRVHERYIFPAFAVLPVLVAMERRWLFPFALLTIAAWANFHAVLSMPLWATPNLESLPYADDARSYPVIVGSIGLTVLAFAMTFVELWGGAPSRRLQVAEAETPPAAPGRLERNSLHVERTESA
jgi:dolichyl-phosphate-mannose-protein mannosyltransferase